MVKSVTLLTNLHNWDYLICFIYDYFQTIARTKDNIVKKQALTYEEIEAEREEVRTQLFKKKSFY